jgi:hypothetical protein
VLLGVPCIRLGYFLFQRVDVLYQGRIIGGNGIGL